jgi:transposase-like protein
VIRDGQGELGAAVAQVYGTRVIAQRGVFHKLGNVADKARENLSGEANRESREQRLAQTRAMYQAGTPAQAYERLSSFVHTWQEQAPKAVATLQRNFEQTIAISALGGIVRELVRTASLLERTHRELRRKFRQACCFSSRRGAEVAI